MARNKPNPIVEQDPEVEVRRLQGSRKLVTFEVFMERGLTMFTPAMPGSPEKRRKELEGAIVRIRPGVGVPENEVDAVRAMVEDGKPVRVIVLPRPREAVIPAAVAAATRSTEGAREAVTSLVQESNTQDREALSQICEKVMGECGL